MPYAPLDITDREFNRVRDIMYRATGVFLRPSKKPLVITRLRLRLKELGLKDFSEYLAYLDKTGAAELETFVNAITTNETFFFRHENQFSFLENSVLPDVLARKEACGRREVRVWSAGCANGAEPYTIALVLLEYFKDKPQWQFRVLASDINTEVLDEARAGIYDERAVRCLPERLKKTYFARREGSVPWRKEEFVICPEVKSRVEFVRHNLLAASPLRENDLVFLRNVFIYFDSDSKQKALALIAESMSPGGYLFISLAESLSDVSSKFRLVRHGVYQLT